MVFSIVKQSIDIRLGFENPPKINADTECAAAIGMLAKFYGLPLPEQKADLSIMRQDLKAQAERLPATEKIEKLEQILYAYEPKAAVDDERYGLLKYSYEQADSK